MMVSSNHDKLIINNVVLSLAQKSKGNKVKEDLKQIKKEIVENKKEYEKALELGEKEKASKLKNEIDALISKDAKLKAELDHPKEMAIHKFWHLPEEKKGLGGANITRIQQQLPFFFKFGLFKSKARKAKKIEKDGGVYIEEMKENIQFGNIECDVTYKESELGDKERMVMMYFFHKAIMDIKYVSGYGEVFFTTKDIMHQTGIKSRAKIDEAIRNLENTQVSFKNRFGSFSFKTSFHIILSSSSFSLKKLKDKKKEEGKADYIDNFLNSLPPETNSVRSISFTRALIEAFEGEIKTTIDMYALRALSDIHERTIFLYLYDMSQWMNKEYLELQLQEIGALLSLNFSEIRDLKKQIKKYMSSVEKVSKFIIDFEFKGRKENTKLCLHLSSTTKQIPDNWKLEEVKQVLDAPESEKFKLGIDHIKNLIE